jgi:hypothetical protein
MEGVKLEQLKDDVEFLRKENAMLWRRYAEVDRARHQAGCSVKKPWCFWCMNEDVPKHGALSDDDVLEFQKVKH